MVPSKIHHPRLPAEWEPHAATHLAWPVNPLDWPGKFAAIRWAFVEFVRHVAVEETVRLVVASETARQKAERAMRAAAVNLDNVVFIYANLDRGWMRDISPFFVRNEQKRCQAVHFQFNGWAKYDNHHLDALWPEQICKELRIARIAARRVRTRVILEGGATDSNGRGSLLTTEECLLSPDVQIRNPGFTRSDYEECLREYLGVVNVIWLGRGILGDDTHGHVDDICRFVNPNTVVLCRETNPKDSNYRPLEENRERLEDAQLQDGSRLQVVFLPMPAPLIFRGLRLPASYANFYITNHAVLAPTFNDPMDRIALGILAELFPDRRIIGIHAVDLAWGFGTLHCLSHEEPAET